MTCYAFVCTAVQGYNMCGKYIHKAFRVRYIFCDKCLEKAAEGEDVSSEQYKGGEHAKGGKQKAASKPKAPSNAAVPRPPSPPNATRATKAPPTGPSLQTYMPHTQMPHAPTMTQLKVLE